MDNHSRSVGRVIAVINQLSVAPRPLSNLELALTLDVPLSSMHRLLQKLTTLGYLDCNEDTACYSVSPRLSELGGRLADVGGYSQPLRSFMISVRDRTDLTVSVWIPTGAHVQISALLVGKRKGPASQLAGEMAEPFSTPGLAIAPQYDDEELRKLIALARRRRVELGRGFTHIAQIRKAVAQVKDRGYASGFNMRGDGWGMLAWPMPITLDPLRRGAFAIGALVSELRRQQNQIVDLVNNLHTTYINRLTRQTNRERNRYLRQ